MFPPREIFFGEPPQEDAPRFATAKAKWDDAYRKKWKIRNGPAGPLPQGLERKLAELARKVYRILAHPRPRAHRRAPHAKRARWWSSRPTPTRRWPRRTTSPRPPSQVGIGYEALIQKILENALKWRSEQSS